MTVHICTMDDHDALAEVYLATFPEADPEGLRPLISGVEVSFIAAKDDRGEISIALAVRKEGLLVLAQPSQVEGPEIREGFVQLVEYVFRTRAKDGVHAVGVLIPETLRKLGEILVRARIIGKETWRIHEVHFTDSAKIARPTLVKPAQTSTISAQDKDVEADWPLGIMFRIFTPWEAN